MWGEELTPGRCRCPGRAGVQLYLRKSRTPRQGELFNSPRSTARATPSEGPRKAAKTPLQTSPSPTKEDQSGPRPAARPELPRPEKPLDHHTEQPGHPVPSSTTSHNDRVGRWPHRPSMENRETPEPKLRPSVARALQLLGPPETPRLLDERPTITDLAIFPIAHTP